ncbi:MAG: sugar phosphate nucleotidyltransferase [Candidatus Peregrinibacteria bacterium]|nr:sugar phosphate nucleotidyltransferase [Candidatus Peregrinibacteria bacterium]
MKIVILAGGIGTRLWPLSRQKKPKQLQSFISNATLLQETLKRIQFVKPSDIYIATNEEFLKEVKIQSKAFRIPPKNFIIEPALRDTAPCIGLAATYLKKHGFGNEVMAIIYADHMVQNKKEFEKLLSVAEKVAKAENTLNIIEVKAKFPSVHLGYVKVGKILKQVDGIDIYQFEKFTEKPNLETAKKFLASYKYLWNTGFYVWRVDTILEKYETYLPQTKKHLDQIKKAIGTSKEKETLKSQYPLCEKISIDYGIMEKVDPKEVRIIPGDLGWSDIGTWEAIYDELTIEEEDNLIKADHIGIDTQSSLIYGHKSKLIVTIGLKDLVIVDTPDALLICQKGRSQDVKKIVEQLQKAEKKSLL